MATKTVNTVKPAYELTVKELVLCFREGGAYKDELTKMPTVKTISVAPDASSKKIYASGGVYDTTVNIRGATITLDLIALGEALGLTAAGSTVIGATAYDVALPKMPEFGLGYVCEDSDGNEVYYWHPRCKLTPSDETHATSDDSDIDPSVSATVECMTTDEGIWKMRYLTSKVTGTAKTADEFFAATPYTAAELQALVTVS